MTQHQSSSERFATGADHDTELRTYVVMDLRPPMWDWIWISDMLKSRNSRPNNELVQLVIGLSAVHQQKILCSLYSVFDCKYDFHPN